jgi:aryl-alcohol dehydrogenase-like predicted oxidoreductase
MTVNRIGFGAMRLPQRGPAFAPGAIPGTSDPGHLADNIAAGALRLTPGDLARLDAVHRDQQ